MPIRYNHSMIDYSFVVKSERPVVVRKKNLDTVNIFLFATLVIVVGIFVFVN